MIKLETLSQDQIKEMNRANIIKIIKQYGEITKQDIAAALKLSIPTVTANTNQLVEEGLVEEAGVGDSTGGRKPMIFKFVENAQYSIGVNITPNRITLLLCNLNNSILDETAFPYEEEYSFEDMLAHLHREINLLLSRNQIHKEKVSGVGIALPGLVDEDRLVLEYAPNIGVRDFDFKTFQEQLQLKLFIENEANVAAYAEIEMGKLGDMRNVVYLSITEGIGAGIIIDRYIYKSVNKKAGEFGHMRVSNEDSPCNCGRMGCWEIFASKKALLRYFNHYTGSNTSSLEQVFCEESFNTPETQAALEEYIRHLFVGIENIILALSPEFVVLGGELGKYGKQMLKMINPTNHMKSRIIEYEGAKIVFSHLQDKGAVIGAALLPFDGLFNYTKNVI